MPWDEFEIYFVVKALESNCALIAYEVNCKTTSSKTTDHWKINKCNFEQNQIKLKEVCLLLLRLLAE